ncbi:MAG: cytochrome c oxidase subunit 3 [Pseudomonadota bacterium]
MGAASGYYVPHEAKWPIVGSIGLFAFFWGFADLVNGTGWWAMALGAAIVIYMMFGWFALVIGESEGGIYNTKVDVSFRMGMGWFIFSEVMFFAAFFGALFYARQLSGPWLGGDGANAMTNAVLYPGFDYVWPSNGPAEIGGDYKVMGWFGLPLINTLLLLSSGITCTIAHHAIRDGDRSKMVRWLFATVALGFIFVGCQAYEYVHAYNDLNLKLTSGIYGSTFFMLTGFHGFHVCMGAIILMIVMFRGMKGHFSAENHFAFEAAAWYWHFVDVVWLGLFLFVYIL